MKEQNLKTRKIPWNSNSDLLITMIILAVDYLAVLASEQAAFAVRNCIMLPGGGHLHVSWLDLYVICPLIYFVFLHINGLYAGGRQFWRVIADFFNSSIYFICTVVILMYAAKITASTSRLYVFLLWGC